ncbi:MAG: lipase secretion chaperone, partial [Steroidobacteraceae bacterium]
FFDYLARRRGANGESQPPAATEVEPSVSGEQALTPDAVTTTAAPQRKPDAGAAGEEPSEPTTQHQPDKVFRIDESGRLIVDEQTRFNMEALLAQTNRNDLPRAQQVIADSLPPGAASDALALLERYDTYQQAQREAYPPGVAPANEEAALAELDGLHALRVAHFGADAAKKLYGAEEELTRSLIESMRQEKDQSLTMEEKAARAQRLRDTMQR